MTLYTIAQEPCVTMAEAAKRLGMTPQGVRYLVMKGILPTVRQGRDRRGVLRMVPLKAVEAYRPAKRKRVRHV